MRIGIIGPSNINKLHEKYEDAKNILDCLIKIVKKYEIVLTPDKGSVSEYFAQEYLKNNGKKVLEIIPLDDKEFGHSWLNLNLGEKINCGSWRNQPEKLNEESDVLLCLGYSTGGLIEIAYSKWFKKKLVYIIKELISQKLPKEIEKDLDLKYVSYKKFKI